ncbi:MAG: acyl-CoA dehydrogenase [Burkholderiaceae bacterium]
MTLADLRIKHVTRPLFSWARRQMPTLSETEREAIDAGEVWFDAELFTGNPDWQVLLSTPPPRLTEAEQAFLDGPCETLCSMLDDWQITRAGDLPPKVWAFMREQGFFGMIIPTRYGGLGFSNFAHSQIVRRISTCSIAAGVTVMVPNSLGPGELLLQFGSDEQRDHWLPRLARGKEIPAFGLTSEDAGSDASAMRDEGVVCKGRWRNETVVGLRLNWSKRYITLGPVCSVLGLAFKLRDPDGLLEGRGSEGITCALVPTDLPGVTIGRRHIPCGQMFQNGPNQGHDVFIPLDHIIGGPDYAGKGWMMLMSALAAGRGISLPSLSCAASSLCAHTTGAYARVREQFNIPVGKFEGVQDRLGRLAANAYMLDAARRLTCAGLDEGRRLAVISGIMKSNATYRMRMAIDAAMDVHAGKTVIDGPSNYLNNLHKAVPVAITVEGANILTRNMIIFGQGAIRCHPYLLDEVLALDESDEHKALADFDKALWAHVGHFAKTVLRAWGRAWTGGVFAAVPASAGPVASIYRQMSRHAAAFALIADAALLTLGGTLKQREMLSARLGDALSELYLLSATLKRWQDDGRHTADLPIVQWAAADSLAVIARSLDETLANLPSRPVAWLLRLLTRPGGAHRGPDDALTRTCAQLLLDPSETRTRLTQGVRAIATGRGALHDLEAAFALTVETDALRRKLREQHAGIDDAEASGLISADEAARLREHDKAVARVIAVDDFDAAEIAPDEATSVPRLEAMA